MAKKAIQFEGEWYFYDEDTGILYKMVQETVITPALMKAVIEMLCVGQ